jgi:flagellar biosynthesis anti-sigma factor FlgM
MAQAAGVSLKRRLDMKVTQNNMPIQMDAYFKQIQQQRQLHADMKPSGPAQAGTTDKVQLSAQAREIQQAAQTSGPTADVRNEKVRQVKMDIDKGTYQVNSSQVATDMLKEAFENNLILRKINTRA